MTDKEIKPSSDRKTKFWKGQKNTYGLLPGRGGSCPGSTIGDGGCWQVPEGKKNHTCYVDNLMKVYGGVRNILQHNTDVMKGSTETEMADILNKEFDRFRQVEARRGKRGLDQNLWYRIHWSGDIFSERYACALAHAITVNSDIRFWCYTRSFFAVPILCNIKHMSLYLSLDPVNYHQGTLAFAEHKTDDNNLQICYMSSEDDYTGKEVELRQGIVMENSFREAAGVDLIKEDVKLRLSSCPVDEKKLALESGCAVCRKCLPDPARRGPKPIWFKS